MPLPQAVLARQQAAIFDRLGEDATWTDVADPVRVMRRESDEEMRLDRGTLIETGGTIKVRKTDVPSPKVGDQVQLLDTDGNPVSGALFEVTADPQLDRRGNWHCTVGPIA